MTAASRSLPVRPARGRSDPGPRAIARARRAGIKQHGLFPVAEERHGTTDPIRETQLGTRGQLRILKDWHHQDDQGRPSDGDSIVPAHRTKGNQDADGQKNRGTDADPRKGPFQLRQRGE